MIETSIKSLLSLLVDSILGTHVLQWLPPYDAMNTTHQKGM